MHLHKKDALAQKTEKTEKSEKTKKKSWLPNFRLTLKDEVILCPGSDTHRSDHHDAVVQSGR